MNSYLHDRYVFPGGAEAVVAMLMRHFGVDENTKLYTLYSSHEGFVIDGKKIPVVTALPAWINRFFVRGSQSRWKLIRFLADYRNLLFFLPQLTWLLRRKIQKDHPERLVISSFAGAKNIVPTAGWAIPTTLYCHSPMQFIRENYDEYVLKLKGLKGWLFLMRATGLRRWDSAPRRYETVFANSKYTAGVMQKIYGLQAQVWYPEIASEYVHDHVQTKPRDYFVYVGRLVQFIREVDRIIGLCNALQLPLLIIGSGPDELYLKSIAGPTIIFLGQISDPNEKIEIIKYAKGVINLAKESCGMSTIEAMLLGVPVFGYWEGGMRELAGIDGQNTDAHARVQTPSGIFVSEKSEKTLIEGMTVFLETSFERKQIREHIQGVLENKVITS